MKKNDGSSYSNVWIINKIPLQFRIIPFGSRLRKKSPKQIYLIAFPQLLLSLNIVLKWEMIFFINRHALKIKYNAITITTIV